MIADLAAIPIDAGTDAELFDTLRLLPIGMGFVFIAWMFALVALMRHAGRKARR